jgi:hypothetical protein
MEGKKRVVQAAGEVEVLGKARVRLRTGLGVTHIQMWINTGQTRDSA